MWRSASSLTMLSVRLLVGEQLDDRETGASGKASGVGASSSVLPPRGPTERAARHQRRCGRRGWTAGPITDRRGWAGYRGGRGDRQRASRRPPDETSPSPSPTTPWTDTVGQETIALVARARPNGQRPLRDSTSSSRSPPCSWRAADTRAQRANQDLQPYEPAHRETTLELYL